jgi:SAM-dependent methyltransferase
MTSMASILRPGRRHWRDFWSKQTTPLHARENTQDYQALAAELRLLFADRTIDRVLEIGCGNGALFTHLGFHTVTRYVGIDFSQAMLAEFGVRYPGVELVEADGANFCSTEKFDLVLSSHVIQYWDRGQLAQHLDHARSMIVGDGLVVLAGIPWSRMRLAHARGDLIGGDLTGGKRRSLPMAALSTVRELILPDIGHWYDFPELKELATTRNFRVAFRGSGYYPSRFHAVLQPRT